MREFFDRADPDGVALVVDDTTTTFSRLQTLIRGTARPEIPAGAIVALIGGFDPRTISTLMDRDAPVADLKARNVDSRPVFPAIPQYPHWPRAQSPQPTAKWVGKRGINLPSGVPPRRDEARYVAAQIREAVETHALIAV